MKRLGDWLWRKMKCRRVKEMKDQSNQIKEDENPKERWDCHSIISTHSTTKNRPQIIREPSKVTIFEIRFGEYLIRTFFVTTQL